MHAVMANRDTHLLFVYPLNVDLYAFGLGVLGALNPCGFPLLPAYLTLFTANNQERIAHRVVTTILTGLLVTVGFVTVFGAFGIASEIGLQLAMNWLPYVMIPIGILLTGIGLATIVGHGPSIRTLHLKAGNSTHAGAKVIFGIAYALGSLSCALPIFIAGVAGAFTREGWLSGIATFVSYALGMGVFLSAAALALVAFGPLALKPLRRMSRIMPALGGVLLAATGTYVAYYWATTANNSMTTSRAIKWVEHSQMWISRWVDAHFASALLVVAVGLFISVLRNERSRAHVD